MPKQITNSIIGQFIDLSIVLLPVQHVMIVDGDLGGDFQPAGLAEDHVLPNFPVGAGLAFAYKQIDLFFPAHLQPPKFLFYFPYKVCELRRGNDAGVPAQIALDKVVLLNDAGTGKEIAVRIGRSAHQPEMVGD